MTTSAAQVFVGIDGGGSNTRAAIVSIKDRSVIAEANGSASNWNSVGREECRKVLHDVVNDALQKAGVPVIVAGIAAGMSGLHSDEDSEMVCSWLKESIPDSCMSRSSTLAVSAFNDTLAALACGSDGHRRGIALIAGTGSNCVAVSSDQQVTAGGWGPLLGKGGSGYSIAASALASCCRAIDGTAASTSLQERIEAFQGWEPQSFRDHVIDWAYSDTTNWSVVASLAPVVFEAAQDGDEVASGLIEDAANRLASDVVAVFGRVDWGTQTTKVAVPIVLVGSLWKQAMMRDVLRKRLDRDLGADKFNFVLPSVTPAVGSALIAMRDHNLY